MSLTMVALIALLSGFLFALIGVSYRFGQPRGLVPVEILTVAGTVAFVCFSWLSLDVYALVSRSFYFWAFFTGLMQYCLVKLCGMALKRGPLSPMWCTMMLSFVPVIVYSCFFLGEPITWKGGLAIFAAIGAVFAASAAGNAAPEKSTTGSAWRTRFFYAFLLLLILIFNSQASITNKVLDSTVDNFSSVATVYLSLLYLGIILPGWIEILIRRRNPFKIKRFSFCVALGAVGTMGGMFCQNLVIASPAALVFTLINASSILSSAILSVVFCGERRTRAWYATLFFALGAIVCSQADAFLHLLVPEY